MLAIVMAVELKGGVRVDRLRGGHDHLVRHIIRRVVVIEHVEEIVDEDQVSGSVGGL